MLIAFDGYALDVAARRAGIAVSERILHVRKRASLLSNDSSAKLGRV